LTRGETRSCCVRCWPSLLLCPVKCKVSHFCEHASALSDSLQHISAMPNIVRTIKSQAEIIATAEPVGSRCASGWPESLSSARFARGPLADRRPTSLPNYPSSTCLSRSRSFWTRNSSSRPWSAIA
jgi:hypothetical protein